MTRPMIVEFNVETQEELAREMNDAEYSQHLIDVEEGNTRRAQVEAQAAEKAAAKAELLATLNLSQETLDLLNGLN
jgi:hypothetical protein